MTQSYLRNRYYDPSTGRFITEDPAKDGANWYTYCGSNPINRIDPSGNNWVTDGLNNAWNRTKWAFQTVGNYANEAQKAVQRSFWKTGAQLLLRERWGYETSAWMLEHSLQDNPSDIWRGNDSRIAGLIKEDSAFKNMLNTVMKDFGDLNSFSTPENKPYGVDFEGRTDLFYSIHSCSMWFSGVKQNDGAWIVNVHVFDTYDYTEFLTLMGESMGYGLGTVANDAAHISQNLGAIVPYTMTVDFQVRWP